MLRNNIQFKWMEIETAYQYKKEIEIHTEKYVRTLTYAWMRWTKSPTRETNAHGGIKCYREKDREGEGKKRKTTNSKRQMENYILHSKHKIPTQREKEHTWKFGTVD